MDTLDTMSVTDLFHLKSFISRRIHKRSIWAYEAYWDKPEFAKRQKIYESHDDHHILLAIENRIEEIINYIPNI